MITVQVDTSKPRKMIENVSTKQLPYAIMQALNNTAFKVKDAEVKALGQHLDRPTPFTQRAYEVVKANRARLIATVKARPVQEEYLRWQVEGGSRSPKRIANVIPTKNQTKNQYGNMTKGAIKSMIADKKRFFSGVPKGWGAGAPAGIWRRLGTTQGKLSKSKRGRVKLQLMVAYEGAVQYRKRLPFYEVGQDEVARVFPGEFMRAFQAAVESAR